MFRSLEEPNKPIQYHRGRVYYTRRVERKVFFVLTLIMLIAGVLYKLGVF